MKQWVNLIVEVTGHRFELLALLVSLGGNVFKWSIVSSDMSINSPSWIRLISLLSTGGSPAPNEKVDGILAEWSWLLDAGLFKSCWPLAPACLPVSGSTLDDASVITRICLIASGGGRSMAFTSSQQRPYCHHCFLSPLTHQKSVVGPQIPHPKRERLHHNLASQEFAINGTTHSAHSQAVSTSMPV